jgi:hypothetical protein
MKIVKSNHKYEAITWVELPKKFQNYFDYLDEDQKYHNRFVKYKKQYYDISDMMRSNIKGWDSYQSDSFFSGVLIKYNYSDDTYTIATYFA